MTYRKFQGTCSCAEEKGRNYEELVGMRENSEILHFSHVDPQCKDIYTLTLQQSHHLYIFLLKASE